MEQCPLDRSFRGQSGFGENHLIPTTKHGGRGLMIWCLFCRTWAPCSHQVNHELLCISKHSRVKCKTMMIQAPANLQIWTYKHVKSLEGFCDLPSYTSGLTLINIIVFSLCWKAVSYNTLHVEKPSGNDGLQMWKVYYRIPCPPEQS